ncbi:hypothetical protein D047_2924B, partial [Vibrio parahaemolyticus VPTS-2010_2]
TLQRVAQNQRTNTK